MIGPVVGKLMQTFIKFGNVKNILEIGTFTGVVFILLMKFSEKFPDLADIESVGYSAVTMAEALPSDGKLVTLEIDQNNANIAKENIAQSPHANKVNRPGISQLILICS